MAARPPLGAAMVLALVVAGAAAQTNPAVVAHRGDSRRAPENTVAAISAAATRAELVEFDVRVSRDGQLVLMHDTTVDRTTDGTGRVADLSLTELRRLDAGSWFGAQFAGERIPTLAEAIAACQAAGLRPMIERKDGDSALYAAELRRLGAVGQVIVVSFDWAFVAALGGHEPTLARGCIGSGGFGASEVQQILATGAGALSWKHRDLETLDVMLAHTAGLEVHSWTANTSGAIRRLIDLGVDGVVSDVPDLAMLVRAAGPPPPIPLGLGRLSPDDPTSNAPAVTVVDARAGFPLRVPAANRGDYDLGSGPGIQGLYGDPLMQEHGVVIANVAELGSVRGALEVPGLRTDSLGGNLSNGGMWLAGSRQAGGAEYNFAATLVWFPFAEGWLGGHVAGDGRPLVVANPGAGLTVSRLGSGRYHVALSGIDARTDGVLLCIGASNEDNRVAAAPRPDGTGWDVALRDESHDFYQGEDDDWSFVYVPFDAPTVIAGRIAGDGSRLAGRGAFTATRLAPGRLELRIPGVDDASDGALALVAARHQAGAAGDEVCRYVFDPQRSAFVVETWDQPGGALVDTEFAFVFTSFATPSVQPIGTGCPGTGGLAPRLGAQHLPFVGNTAFALDVDDARPGSPTYLLAAFAGAAQPFDLGGGCLVYLDLRQPGGLLVAAGPATTSSTGAATLPLPLPDIPALIGAELWLQAAVLDPGAVPRVAVSGALRLRF